MARVGVLNCARYVVCRHRACQMSDSSSIVDQEGSAERGREKQSKGMYLGETLYLAPVRVHAARAVEISKHYLG